MDQPVPRTVKHKDFHDPVLTASFLRHLTVTPNYWERLLYSGSASRSSHNEHPSHWINRIAGLIIHGNIRIYKIENPAHTLQPNEKRILQDRHKTQHVFMPASSLLAAQPKALKTFASEKEARDFIRHLQPDEQQLEELSKELELEKTSITNGGIVLDPHNNKSEQTAALISSALASGAVVVFSAIASKPPRPEPIEESASHSNKSPGLGPDNEKYYIEMDYRYRDNSQIPESIPYTATFADGSKQQG